jgi:hypothetical protein
MHVFPYLHFSPSKPHSDEVEADMFDVEVSLAWFGRAATDGGPSDRLFGSEGNPPGPSPPSVQFELTSSSTSTALDCARSVCSTCNVGCLKDAATGSYAWLPCIIGKTNG